MSCRAAPFGQANQGQFRHPNQAGCGLSGESAAAFPVNLINVVDGQNLSEQQQSWFKKPRVYWLLQIYAQNAWGS
jgi:hypothetical protein